MQIVVFRSILSATLSVLVGTTAVAAAQLQQSKCEIEATKYAMAHPREGGDPNESFRVLQEKGFFPFNSLDAPPPRAVSSYSDPETGNIFTVNSDGRHVSAKNANGQLLWISNPFVDTNMCPYRTIHPYISRIGAAYDGRFTPAQIVQQLIKISDLNPKSIVWRTRPKSDDRFVWVTFNSSQRGYVNIRNGYFYFMGQD